MSFPRECESPNGDVRADVGVCREFQRQEPVRVARTLSMSSHASIGIVFARPKKSIRDVLERLILQRRQAQLRKELWRQHADPVAKVGSLAANLLLQDLVIVERRLAQLPEIAWRRRSDRIQLPALCGSRPYFPAAP